VVTEATQADIATLPSSAVPGAQAPAATAEMMGAADAGVHADQTWRQVGKSRLDLATFAAARSHLADPGPRGETG
jgi:hypothetical protein